MKFALTSPIDGETLEALAARCQCAAATGAEINSPPPLVETARRILTDAGLQVACISTGTRFTGQSAKDTAAAMQIRSCLEWAQHVGCHLVKIDDPLPERRESLPATISALADWLTPLANAAADRGITIAIENGQTLPTARAMWLLMERVDHAAMGVCWNVDHSLKIGERPAVVVPTLNSRIRYVRMAIENSEAISWLQRIGYAGWIAREKGMATDEKSPGTKG